jgi:hypothetical protein
VNPLTEQSANAVYNLLVAHAGASPDGRDGFVYGQTMSPCTEWRFCGSLGMGGKFRRNTVWIGPDRRERWWVDCYREDEIPERLAAIEATNKALAELTKEPR